MGVLNNIVHWVRLRKQRRPRFEIDDLRRSRVPAVVPSETSHPVRYNIVLPAKPAYIHSRAFFEVGRLLQCSFQSLGHDCRFQPNTIDPGAVNVLLGYHLFKNPESVASISPIIYQLEQLSDREGWFNERSLEILKAAREVWDYSSQNIEFLRRRGVKRLKLLPIGYHQDLETIQNRDDDIDVLFYGTLNHRRRSILSRLSRHHHVQVLSNVYGKKRDQAVARSRIVLNIHYYPAQILEQVRIAYLLNNQRFVLTESSPGDLFAGGIAVADYDQLVDRCGYFLRRPDERLRIAARGYHLLRNRPMVRYLRDVLSS